MFTAALFTVDTTWKQPNCPSVNERIKKLSCVHIMEYYSVIKNKTLPFVAIWMDLQGIMHSEMNQRNTNTM